MKKSYQRFTILFGLILFLTSILLNSNLITNNILDYTNLFLTKLFPSSFIFYITSSLLIDYGLVHLLSKLLPWNGNITYVTLMSLVSGFPSGSKYTKDLLEKNYITLETANYLTMFTHFPNPLFVLTTVYSILKNKKITILLLVSIIISNLLIAIFFHKKEKENNLKEKEIPKDFPSSLKKAIISATKTILTIYGTSLFFYLIAVLITNITSPTIYSYVLINGFFDLTKGITSTALLKDTTLQSIFIIIFIALGGVSIHMQVKSILADTKINYKYFLLGRIISTLFSIILFFIFLTIM